MAIFIQAVDARTGWIVHVNADLIRTAAPDPSGGTVVNFDSEHFMVLKDDLEAVMRKLENAPRP